MNKEENETLQIKTIKLMITNWIFFNGQNLLLQQWKFSNKNFFRYVKNHVSCYISLQIGMCKWIFVKNVVVLGLRDRRSLLKNKKIITLNHYRFFLPQGFHLGPLYYLFYSLMRSTLALSMLNYWLGKWFKNVSQNKISFRRWETPERSWNICLLE